MCRRCGEPDKRGSSRDRRRSKLALLAEFGDGVTCPCAWCGAVLTALTLQRDRLDPRGTYRRENIVPSCGPCNRARAREPMTPACQYG